MNGWHVSGGHHGPDHIAPMNRPSDRAPKASDPAAPAVETTTVTQYAVRVHNLVYDTTWLEMRTEDLGRADSWAREVGAEDFNEATVVTREVTTTEWAEVQ